eukprot:31136-Pelagococcus_subviridis.AAC.7
MTSARDSPSTKLIVRTRLLDIASNAAGHRTSGTARVTAPPILVSISRSLSKSNSNGTWFLYSRRIDVWSNGRWIFIRSIAFDTNSMFAMSIVIRASDPGF